MYSNLAFLTFIFYLYSFFFYNARWRFVLQTEISGKYNSPLYFCSLSIFFLSLFQTVRISLLFKSELWYSRFYWSRSTKDPADPHWFVLVLPSQVFLSYHQVPSPQSIKYRASHQHVQLQIFRETFSWWLLFRFWPPWDIVIDSFSVTCLLFNLLERLSSVSMWTEIRYRANQMRRHLSYSKRTAEKPCVTSVTQTSPFLQSDPILL